jgi:hypothetical protein
MWKFLPGVQNRSLNGKLTPVKVTRHTMPQKGREQIKIQNKTKLFKYLPFINIFKYTFLIQYLHISYI